MNKYVIIKNSDIAWCHYVDRSFELKLKSWCLPMGVRLERSTLWFTDYSVASYIKSNQIKFIYTPHISKTIQGCLQCENNKKNKKIKPIKKEIMLI